MPADPAPFDPAPFDPAPFDPTSLFGPAYRLTGPAEDRGGGFSGAGVRRTPTAAGVFALRLWPAAPPPRARLDGLHALLTHAARTDPGLPIAPPLPARDGRTLFPLGDRLAQWEPWLPGDPLPLDPSASELTAAAAALARFHAAAEGFDPPPAARTYFAGTDRGTPPSLTARRDRLARWLSGGADRAETSLRREPPSPFGEPARALLGVLRDLGPGLLDRLRDAARTPVPLAPALRDAHREHLLLSRDEDGGDRVTGLIDPSAALADTPAADLARLAGSLRPGRLEPLLNAYRAARPLSDAEVRLARVLHDGGVLLSGLAWVARGTFEERPDARAPAAVDRLVHFAHAAERLEGTA